MHSFKLLSLLGGAATAAVLPRTNTVPTGACCFTLQDSSSGDVVQQSKANGFLYLDANQPNGWYCIDLSNTQDILLDSLNNACFLNTGSQFQCLDPTIGPNAWTLSKDGTATLLAHDGSTAFTSCPSQNGGQALYGSKSGDGCKSVTLKATGFQGTCQNFTS